MHPILLIAEREFRTYVATLSFWIAISFAPLAASLCFFLLGTGPARQAVSVESSDGNLAKSAVLAVLDAGRLEGRILVIGRDGPGLRLSRSSARDITLEFSNDFPLSASGRAVVGHVIERDAVQALLPASRVNVRIETPQAKKSDAAQVSRLTAMTMLWLALTGSLGMLLQAIVRERANRALESLLASVRASQIIAGKILGVGLVSLLVLLSWYGSAFAMALSVGGASAWSPVLTAFTDPIAIIRNLMIYVCAFAFYGAVTLVVGALARDSASAQNLARPMFICLLCGFLVALFGANSGAAAGWLVYFPPFTPFLLVAHSSGDVALLAQFLLLAPLAVVSALTIFIAGRCLTFSSPGSTCLFRLGARHH